ncbi:MAG: hypothetical protein AAFP17_08335 [Pseudomonadota bacterium]
MPARLPIALPAPRAAARLSAATALAALLAVAPAGQAAAQPVPEWEFGRLFGQILVQTALSFARGAVELTYEGISVDPRSGEITISGLVLRPELPHDSERACEVSVARITLAGGGRFDRVDGTIGIGGLSLPAVCLEPEPAAMVSALGYPVIDAETVSIDLAYDERSSALDIDVVASIANGALVSVAAEFAYFWFKEFQAFEEVDAGSVEDVEVVAILSGAEIMIENRGLFEAVEPMIGAQLGDPAAIPAIAQAGLMQALTENGARTPSPAELEFVEELSGALGRFVQEKDRLVVTLAPPTPVRLGEDAFDDPAAAIALLAPTVGAAPAARAALLDPALLTKAASTPDALSAEERLTVGSALLSGIGAPRARREGIALLEPLIDEGSGPAALLLAEAMMAEGALGEAYVAALTALAAGESAAVRIADEMEVKLPLDEILFLQGQVSGTVGDDALIEAADVAGMRVLAERLVSGRGGPRSYESALYWASLAAASGDRAAAAILRRLDSRYTSREAEAETWADATAEASDRALETWVNGGLAARVAAQ